MNAFLKISLVIFVALIFSRCEEEDNPQETYQYSGFDGMGIKIIAGSFSIEPGDSIDITGQWNFEALGAPENIGPQIGTGLFIGSIDGNVFAVNLNPQFVDNNVNLWGTISGNQIIGEWYYSGFPGVINQGTFTAQK